MTSRRIELMLATIKNQNEYDYKISQEKEKIIKNIEDYKTKKDQDKKIKKEKFKNNIKITKKITELNKDYKIKNPSECIIYNSERLVPIFKDSIYNYINKYNFDRNKALNKNEKNRMRINKSVDFKLHLYTINKNNHMNNIKNLFGKKNLLFRKKTENILENIKITNDQLRLNINLKHAKQHNDFINYLKLKNIENKKYNDDLNNKRKLAKEKYENYLHKKDIKLLEKLRGVKSDDINVNKNIKTINNNNNDRVNKKLKIIKSCLNEDKIKENKQKINLNIIINKNKIIEKEKEYFHKAKTKEDLLLDKKNKFIKNEQNNIIQNEIKLNKAKSIYNQIYKSEIIYKKEKLPNI